MTTLDNDIIEEMISDWGNTLVNTVQSSISEPSQNSETEVATSIVEDITPQSSVDTQNNYSNYPNFENEDHIILETPTTIPENPQSILVKENTSRFSGAEWYTKITRTSVTLAGVGGIGSYVAFLLSRMNIRHLSVYDPDTIEEVNMSGQLYSFSQIGSSKVDGIYNTISNYSRFYNISCFSCRYTEDRGTPSKIMICGFDNMEARSVYFNSWKNYVMSLSEEERATCLFLDGRLAAEEFQVLCITGADVVLMSKYEDEWLFTDEEADATICSYKQTTYMANMIGSIIVNLFTNFIANQCDPLIPRELPFLTEYSGSTMYFKTSM